MEDEKKNYWASYTALCFVGVAVFLQAAEGVAKDYDLEFRIYIQVVKGIFIWLVMPVTVAFAMEHDFIRERVRPFFRYLALTIAMILILGAASFRGLVYFFNEMVTEEVLEDGRIRGCWSTLAGDVFYYYEPVYGIFKTPFPGWSEEELAEILRQRHGEGITFVEATPEGERIYQASGSRPGSAPFYFRVWGDYYVEDNFLYSLMKSDATGFWANKKKRALSFVDRRQQVIELEEEERWNNKEHPESEDRLMVKCYSREDVTLCAADLADWLFYAAEDGRYLVQTDDPERDDYLWSPDALFSIWINYNGGEGYSWEKRQESLLSVKEALAEGDWEGVKTQIEAQMNEYYDKLEEKKAADGAYGETGVSPETEEDTKTEEETEQELADWEESFLDFTFLDETFGFASLMHNGGDEAELYVTEDGGKTYKLAVLQGLTVTLEDGYVYNPYDYPQMPYEEDGKLYLLCGQGADGDYNGGDGAALALFESADHGHTFVFKEMQERNDS